MGVVLNGNSYWNEWWWFGGTPILGNPQLRYEICTYWPPKVAGDILDMQEMETKGLADPKSSANFLGKQIGAASEATKSVEEKVDTHIKTSDLQMSLLGHVFPTRFPSTSWAPWVMWTLLKNINTSSTAQGGGRSFKNRKPIGEVGSCESQVGERIHWWNERWLWFLEWLQWSPHPQLQDVVWCSEAQCKCNCVGNCSCSVVVV